MYVLSNARKLYDGTAPGPEAVHEDVDLVIEEGRVRELASHDPGLAPAAPRIDCSELFVTPGLCDAHCHVAMLGSGSDELARLKRILQSHQGGCPVILSLRGANGRGTVYVQTSREHYVSPCDELKNELESAVGRGAVAYHA